MDSMQLPEDFKEFLKLLNSEKVEYLLVGGYAVGHYGFPRATMDMDIWIASSPGNARKIVHCLQKFGFKVPALNEELFLKPDQIVRFGRPPLRLEVLTTISGVKFSACYKRRNLTTIDGVEVSLIGTNELKTNKKAGEPPQRHRRFKAPERPGIIRTLNFEL